MASRFIVRRGAPVAALVCLIAAVVAGCSTAPPTEKTDSTSAMAEPLHVGPSKCGPCELLVCQTCGPEDGCPKPRIVCSCETGDDGASCRDGNKCDLPGTCQGGACVAGGKVTCPPPDQCHVAACSSTTGQCASSPAPDGTACGQKGQVCFQGGCITPCGLATCASQHMQCGPTGDGCGHIIECGTCAAPETCGGGGVHSVCGAPQCTRQTCAQIGATCGEQSDGCGGLMNCGSCTAPQTCGGGGVHSVCGSGPTCTPKTCASYPAGTCGQQADGCGGMTPDCSPCAAPQTCGGAGTRDHCGYCGGFGYAKCPGASLCNQGAIDDGNGHCVQCDTVHGTFAMNTTAGQPTSGYWNVEFDYSLGLPSTAYFPGLVSISSTSGSNQSQTVEGPTGKVFFQVPMLTQETTNIYGSITKLGDPVCVVELNPAASVGETWSDPVPTNDNKCPSTPTLSTNGEGSRGGPVQIVPLMWGYNDTAFAAYLDGVYSQLQSSNYWAWLTREYGAPQITHAYPIGLTGVDTSVGAPLESQLADIIRANAIPTQGTNMYVVHLKPGMTVTMPNNGPTLCVSPGTTVAYNYAYKSVNLLNGTFTYYLAVIPDPSISCFGNTLGRDGMTVALSHEVAENMTDPDTTGWEARACGAQTQIGDLCAGELPIGTSSKHVAAIQTPIWNTTTQSNTLVVQKLWSNARGKCVTEDSAAGVPFN